MLVLLTATCQQRVNVSDLFREQLIKFLESAGELDASSNQGLSFGTLEEQLPKIKSSYQLVKVIWPERFELDAKQSFEDAIRGWDLALDFWHSKINRGDDPVEPNINGYQNFLTYAGNNLDTGVHGDSFLVEEYRGRKYIALSDKNLRILLTLASAHFNSGRSSVLSAVSPK